MPKPNAASLNNEKASVADTNPAPILAADTASAKSSLQTPNTIHIDNASKFALPIGIIYWQTNIF